MDIKKEKSSFELEHGIIESEEALYANVVGMEIGDRELVLRFEQRIKGVKDKSITVVCNPAAIFDIKKGADKLSAILEGASNEQA